MKQFDTWWHCLDSVWILKSTATASDIYNYLRPHIDDDDKLIVILRQREAAWTPRFDTNCQDWLRKNL